MDSSLIPTFFIFKIAYCSQKHTPYQKETVIAMKMPDLPSVIARPLAAVVIRIPYASQKRHCETSAHTGCGNPFPKAFSLGRRLYAPSGR